MRFFVNLILFRHELWSLFTGGESIVYPTKGWSTKRVKFFSRFASRKLSNHEISSEYLPWCYETLCLLPRYRESFQANKTKRRNFIIFFLLEIKDEKFQFYFNAEQLIKCGISSNCIIFYSTPSCSFCCRFLLSRAREEGENIHPSVVLFQLASITVIL